MTTQRTALLGTKSSKQDFKDFRGMFGITVMSWKPVEITGAPNGSVPHANFCWLGDVEK